MTATAPDRPASAPPPPSPVVAPVRRGLAAVPLWARWTLAVVVLTGVGLAFQGSRPLWEPDEGRYVAVALEMNRLGDYMVPRLHRQLEHLTKPPLTYWLIAASVGNLGRSERAVRMPNTLAYVATVLLVYGIGRRLRPADAAAAAVVYATFLMPWVAANVVTTDTLLTAWESLAVWGFASWWWGAGGRHRGWLILMWLGFGLAFLTKGPVGLVPLLAIVALVAGRDGARGLAALFPVAGLIVFGVVGFGWYIAMVARNPELLEYFLGYEFVDRVVSDVHGRNAQWYGAAVVYLPVLLLGTLPWTVKLLAQLPRAAALVRPSRWRAWLDDDPALFFTLAWFLLPLLVFVVARSRLHLYVLPLFPALALLAARVVRAPGQWRRGRLVLVAAWIGLMVGLRAVAPLIPTDRDARAWAREIEAVGGGAYDEIALVHVRNGFGLGFYLDRELEHVALTADDLKGHCVYCRQTVEQELREHERWLFVVDSRFADAFEAVVRGEGYRPELAGTVRDDSLYLCR